MPDPLATMRYISPNKDTYWFDRHSGVSERRMCSSVLGMVVSCWYAVLAVVFRLVRVAWRGSCGLASDRRMVWVSDCCFPELDQRDPRPARLSTLVGRPGPGAGCATTAGRGPQQPGGARRPPTVPTDLLTVGGVGMITRHCSFPSGHEPSVV